MLPIVVFFVTAMVHRVYSGLFWDCRYRTFATLQQWDIKPPPYICFSSGNVDIVTLMKPTAINTSFYADGIAAVEKNAAIFKL